MGNSMQNRLNESGWARLLEEIDRGNVIPVLGHELFTLTVEGKEWPLREYILQKMRERLGVEDSVSDFAELSYEYNIRAWDRIQSEPYYETTRILQEVAGLEVEFLPELQELLSIEKFRLVLSTSFDDLALKAMENFWGKGKVKRLSYEKRSCKEDIDDLSKPCLYQMFGKAGAVPHEFVLTEDDLLEFLHYWLDENYRPKRLSNVLREKYLLVIGCNYPNWLFRFFFHSLKFSSRSSSTDKVGMLADSRLDKSLVDFLSRMNAGVHEDARAFIRELVKRWKAFRGVEDQKEIFISYASEDYEQARRVAETFQNLGVAVWFDKKSLEPGDAYEAMIKQNIQESKIFVPVLSQSVVNCGRRFFKREWKWANDELELRFPEKFIYPVVIDDVSLEDSALQIFSKFHTVDLREGQDWEYGLRKIVRDVRLLNS